MTIEKAEQNIRQALKDYGAHTAQQDILEDVSDSFIWELARDSVEAKQNLRELFEKSPVWNPELDALVINGTRTHDPDYNRICDLADKITRSAWENLDLEKQATLNYAMGFFWRQDVMSESERENRINAINELAPKAYAPGKKLSRVFKALCQAIGVADETQGSEFQRLYAQFADELSSKKIDFKLYVSINPAHFVTMSNPKGDARGQTLTSCHSFNSTSYTYNCGCAGYARDRVTFIVFTVDDPTNPESFNNRKTTRQIFAYRPGSGLLLQSRMYNTEGGVYGAAADSTLYRDLIQRELSALENVPNLWQTYHSYEDPYARYVVEGDGFGGYADWTYDNFDGHVSIRVDCDRDCVRPLEVGTYGLCVKCGREISEGMYCDDCQYSYTCDDCGEGCDDTFPVYDPRGRERYVCESCLETYTRCERCGEYHDNGYVYWVGDYAYCEDCVDEVSSCCEDCGERYFDEDLHCVYDHNGNECCVCDSCMEDYVSCPHCGERVELCEDGTCPHCGAVVEKEEEVALV